MPEEQLKKVIPIVPEDKEPSADKTIENFEKERMTASESHTEKEEMLLGNGNRIMIKENFIGMMNNGILTCDRKKAGKFRNFDGWGLSRQLIFEMVQACKERGMIVFNIKDEGKTVYILRVSAINFQLKGIPYFNPKLKEEQLILPEALWDKGTPASVKIIR